LHYPRLTDNSDAVKVLIVGANGKVGTLLSGKMWASSEFSPVALIRDSKQQTKFTALGVPSILGDLEDGISSFLAGFDSIKSLPLDLAGILDLRKQQMLIRMPL
jgi:putative NADH-flavin reductase